MQDHNRILKEITSLLASFHIPMELGVFTDVVPDEYIVLTPMSDVFDLYADNLPQSESQEVRISLFTKHNYLTRKNEITALLLNNEFTITDRRYIAYEEDTKFHHLAIDVVKQYAHMY